MAKNCTILSDRKNSPRKRNNSRLVFFVVLLTGGGLSFSSCEAMEHWLYNASDYSIITSKNYPETDMNRMDQYWDDLDYDIWYEENEYD